MHFLHDRSHGWGCLVLHLLLFENIPRDPTFVFLLQRFVFQKVWSHDPVDLFEILEDCESGRFFFAWHVLRQVVVRIQLHRSSPCLIESNCWCWRCPMELRIHVERSNYIFFVTRGWSTKQVMPLPQELRVLSRGLNLMVIIQWFFSCRGGYFVVTIHHFWQAMFTHLV